MCEVCMGRRRFLTALAAIAAASESDFALAAPTSDNARKNLLIRSANVITLDSSVPSGAEQDILIVDGKIEKIGRALPVRSAEVIDARDMIAIPGLVETHWHMWNTLLRNRAGETEATGYFPMQLAAGARFTPEDNALGTAISLLEAISGGITTIHNWSHNLLSPDYADAEIQVMRRLGVRGRFSYGYSRNTRKNETLPFDDILRVKQTWFSGGASDLLDLGLASKGPLTNTVEVCAKEWDFARKNNLPITTHLGMYPGKATGISALANAGLLAPDNLLIHCTNASEEEVDMIARSKAFVSLSPFTEMRTGFGMPPLTRFIAAGIPLSLSIDTTALSGNADMLTVMHATQNLGDGTPRNEFGIKAQKVLELATIDGARALGLDKKIGSLTPGKRADVVLIRTTDINMLPAADPVRMVVQSAQPANVDTVIVDGRILKRGGRLVGVDMAALNQSVKTASARIFAT